MNDDPVQTALERAADKLPPDDRPRFFDVMRTALATFDPVVGPEDRAVEITSALAVAPQERMAAAERFASHRRTFDFGRRSGELLQDFASGRDVAREARRLMDEILPVLEEELHEDVRRRLGDYLTECRYILSGGTGPNSLRGSKFG
jgi:hypothetical protein